MMLPIIKLNHKYRSKIICTGSVSLQCVHYVAFVLCSLALKQVKHIAMLKKKIYKEIILYYKSIKMNESCTKMHDICRILFFF